MKKIASDNLDLAAFLKSLRERIGGTQEGMARRLRCSTSGYQKWELGRARPRGPALLAIAALCPDDEWRDRLSVAMSPAAASKHKREEDRQFAANPTLPFPERDERLRQLSDAIQGLNLIYEAAEAGYQEADELLRELAGELTARGAEWRRMKYLKRSVKVQV